MKFLLELWKLRMKQMLLLQRQLTYVIKITNKGPSVAENVILMDEISNKLCDKEFSTDGGNT